MKDLPSCCFPYLNDKKKISILKINDFSWTHQRTEVTGQIATTKSGETDKSRVTADQHSWSKSHWSHDVVGPLNGKFVELLEGRLV